jgi:hypothetical protein
MKSNLSAADRFEVFLTALILANEQGRLDLVQRFKLAAQQATAEMKYQNQQAKRAAARGAIRRVVSADGRYS